MSHYGLCLPIYDILHRYGHAHSRRRASARHGEAPHVKYYIIIITSRPSPFSLSSHPKTKNVFFFSFSFLFKKKGHPKEGVLRTDGSPPDGTSDAPGNPGGLQQARFLQACRSTVGTESGSGENKQTNKKQQHLLALRLRYIYAC